MTTQEVQFTLTVDDLVALGTYTQEHHPDGRKKSEFKPWTNWFLVGCAIVLAALFLLRTTQGPAATTFDLFVRWFTVVSLGIVLLGLILYAFLPALRRYEVRRLLRRPEFATAVQPQTFRIMPVGLTVVSGDETQTGSWRAFNRIVVTADHAFLFTGPTQALILPRRAFRDEGEFLNFVEAMQRYHEVAMRIDYLMKGGPAPDPSERQP